jgi:hypothetical protein
MLKFYSNILTSLLIYDIIKYKKYHLSLIFFFEKENQKEKERKYLNDLDHSARHVFHCEVEGKKKKKRSRFGCEISQAVEASLCNYGW